MSESTEQTEDVGIIGGLLEEFYQPWNLVLTSLIVFLIYKIFIKSAFHHDNIPAPPPSLPKLRKDMTLSELSKYTGTGEEERILLAVNGNIFDVTKGKRFYGPGGPYSAFAGRDATRGLATGNVAGSDKEFDDLSDLTKEEIESAKEWEDQFRERYYVVGKLLKPGEQPTEYSTEETDL